MSEFEDALSKQRPNCMSGLALTESREKGYQSRILNRTKELEELSSIRGEDLQTKCLRDAERLSRLEEEWNFMKTRKRKNFAEVFSARDSRSKLKKSLKRQKEKRNAKILAWHLEQRTWRLVKESKNERLTTLLQGTNRLLFNLGAAVQHQKDAKHADSIGPVEESDADMNELDYTRNRSPSHASLEDDEDIVDSDRNDDNGDLLKGQRRYNAAIHSVQEKVTEQPSILKCGQLREYQLEGLQWMLSLFNNNFNRSLADEMGLGKTIQAISLIAYLKEKKNVPGPHLIVAPKGVLPNWINEFSTWVSEDEYEKSFLQSRFFFSYLVIPCPSSCYFIPEP